MRNAQYCRPENSEPLQLLITAARLPLQNEVLLDLFTNELLRSLKPEFAQLRLKGWSADGRDSELRGSDLFKNEFFARSRSLKLESVQRLSGPGRLCLQATLFVIADRFRNELVGRGRSLSVDSLRSLLTGGRGLLQAVVFADAGRFMNELFTRGCTCVVPGIGWRNRAVENAGCR